LKSHTLICTALLSLMTLSAVAAEAPVKILATIAVQGAFADIEPLLSPRAGVPVKMGFAQTSSILERLMHGEAADLVILTKQAAESLAAKGRVQSQTDLVAGVIGIAVADNARPPILKTTEDFVAFLKATPSIAYTSSGVSGLHMAQLIEKFGLTNVMKPKTTLVADGFAAPLLRQGKVAAAVQQISELKFGGANNIVPLPDAIQLRTVFTVAVVNGTTRADAAARVLRVLTSPDASAIYQRSGLSPVFK
jgi:molybdate transport system substrate-binding protein